MAVKKRLAGPAQLGAAAATLYTCPSGKGATIRQILLTNPSGGTDRTVTLSVGTDAAGTRSIAAARTITANGVAVQIYGPIELAASEIIQGSASAATEVVYEIHGEEYAV